MSDGTTTALADSGVAVGNAVILRIDPTADSHWDADLEACPGATFFHGASWARVMQGTYGFKPVYFVVRCSGRLESLLPMMEVDSWLTGRRGVSLPFTDECAPLCTGPDAFGPLYQTALDYGRIRHWKYLECRGGLHLHANPPPSVSFLGHRLDLRGGETSLFSRCESSTRRAIRKAEQGGLTIEWSRDLEAVAAFYGLLCKTRRRHGVPPQPLGFFANIHRHVLAQRQGWVVLARLGQRPVAGAIYFSFRKTATYKFGASDDKFQHLRANNLVMWEAIKHYAKEEFDNLDFGRTSLTNEGLQRFKRSWGAVEYPIDYVRHDMRTGGISIVRDAASGLHTRILAKLPDPAFRLIGSLLYKHMS